MPKTEAKPEKAQVLVPEWALHLVQVEDCWQGWACAILGIGPVVAAGWLSATLAGAVGGAVAGGAAGGLIGALIDSGVPDDEAHVYAEGDRRGGVLVSGKVDDKKSTG